ncbi:hypothetical protein ACIRST_21705 [Kitasatospora sp. NPDC101447]|uniref:hypothetical protein n=1 Tax=Kitasatospora sp. NPDC101447 TaxID=3364102 RepID=UPI003800875C
MASAYELNINPEDDADWITNQDKKRVAIAKQVNTGVDISTVNPANVAWQVFAPLNENKITWEASYSVYASTTPVAEGAHISQSSVLHTPPPPAEDGVVYEFNGSIFKKSDSKAEKGSYWIKNTSKQLFQFGITQEASSDKSSIKPGYSPLIIVPGGGSEILQFTPHETVYVYLTGHKESATVSVNAWGPVCKVQLSAGTPVTLKFIREESRFEQV